MKWLFVGLFVGWSMLTMGQAKVSGTLSVEDGSPAAGAFIRLMLPDSITMKKFTAANEGGVWQFKRVKKGDYLLNVRYLGYKELFYSVHVEEEDSAVVHLQLEPDALLLPGVEVTADAIGITRSGDTLKFNVKYFSTGAEMSLGDVLNQLPGVEVGENGTVFYAGKKVDKLLVQGKDILNNKHKLATENIRANQLSGVYVINDYRDDKDIETQKSGKTALDVRIKKSEQDKWSGQFKLLGGYKNKLEAGLSSFKIDEKFGITIFAKANNVGELAMSAHDYIGLKGSQIYSQLGRGQDVTSLLPKGFVISPQTTSNLDAVLAGSFDQDLSKKSALKGDFIFADLSRREAQFFVRQYTNSSEKMSANQKGHSSQPMASLHVLSETKFNKELNGVLGLGFNYEKLDKSDVVQGLYSGHNFLYNNDLSLQKMNIMPELIVKYSLGEKSFFKFSSSWALDVKKQVTSLSDIVPFLGLDWSAMDSVFYFQQVGDSHSTSWNSQVKYTYDINHFLTLNSEASLSYNNLEKVYSTDKDVKAYSGSLLSKQNLMVSKVSLVLDTSHWVIDAGVFVLANHLELNQVMERQPVQLFPILSIYYKFHSFHSISLEYSVEKNIAAPAYGSKILEAQDTRQSNSYAIDWQNSALSKNLSFQYFNFALPNLQRLMVKFGYSIYDNNIGTNVIAHPTYTELGLIRMPEQVNITGAIMYRTRVANEPLVAITNYRMSHLDGWSVYQSDFSKYELFSHNMSIGLSSKWKKRINYKINYTLNLSKQKLGGLGRTNQFVSHTPKLELSYADKKGFIWKNYLSYRQSYGQSLASQDWKFDIDMEYKIKKKPFRIFLKGRNLLNLTSIQQVNVGFKPSFIEERSYRSFPGYVLSGISWEF